MSLLFALAAKYAALIGIVTTGLLTLTFALANRLLPADPLGALVGGYLVYAAGCAIATLFLLAPAFFAPDEAR